MGRIVWGILGALCVLLSAFILYLTFTYHHPGLPMRGFVIAAVLLGLSAYPFSKLRPAPPGGGASGPTG